MNKVTIKPKKNLSLFPLKAEDALCAFMKVDPKRILETEEREKLEGETVGK
jgi:hypothetical protein